MELCNGSCSFVRPDGVLRGKSFKVGHDTNVSTYFLFTPAMLRGSCDFYHFTSLSLTLTLPGGGHKVSAKQSLLASFSPILFI